MATSHRAPKLQCLTKTETFNTFESWRQTLIYVLTLDPNFAGFLVEGARWQKKTKGAPLRGFTNDPQTAPAASRRTAQQKVTQLEIMLGQVANFCPIISRNTIVKNSTCMEDIWQAIRMHFGFQTSGAHFIDFADIKLESEERPEDLYQRLMSFVEDSLLSANGPITHNGEQLEEDEEMTPSLDNMVVLTWLRLIHPELPRLVKQRYGTELRSRTLASIKPEISQALSSLLEEIHTTQEAKVMRSATFSGQYKRHQNTGSFNRGNSSRSSTRSCPLCKQAGRKDTNHFLSTCTYLPENDRKFITKARIVHAIEEESENFSQDDDSCEFEEEIDNTKPANRRVQVKQSPYLNTFYKHHQLKITIDSGAETNMIRESTAVAINAKITPSSQLAYQADGQSPLSVVGEMRIKLSRDDHEFVLEALVVKNMDVDILAGVPFMDYNDISVRPAKRQVIVGDGAIYEYGISNSSHQSNMVRRTQARVLRAPSSPLTVWPGEYVEISVPTDVCDNTMLALEPRVDSSVCRPMSDSQIWPKPEIITSVGDKIRIPNDTEDPIVLRKNEHFCQVLEVDSPLEVNISTELPSIHVNNITSKDSITPVLHSSKVILDPDQILPNDVRSEFQSVLEEYDHVFDPIYKGYNGASGPFKAVVNMGPVLPPQRKGRVPQYSRDKLVELQQKFDELESLGVFARPEDVGIVVEYLNVSFLVKKSSGAFRLVTAFADVGRYSKPQPSLMPDVDSTLRNIGRWKYVIVTDLMSAFYQIPLDKESMKYCGVATPFKGIRVYTRCAMGMPGSETALEELMCRVLGDLLQDGIVAKIADDLYCGGDTPTELLQNWIKVLVAMSKNRIGLSAPKTIIAPLSTVILGWVWSKGALTACQHRIATLSACSPPDTVRGLRSYIGAYKVLSRVIPNCADHLSPLDEIVAGKQSSDRIVWSDTLRSAFTESQKRLADNRSVVLPHPNDQIWIVTDGAVKKYGIGATMYVTKQGKIKLAGHFSAKLRKRQLTWIPCEIEALSIAAAVKHFSPYLIQSKHKACVLTDSKPCTQAYEKLCRGEFSASVRVTTFLTTVSRYQVSLRHLAGSANLPSDFASRNAVECENPNCQICTFVNTMEQCVVAHVTTEDVLSGSAKLPFTSRSAWQETQSDCSDLKRTKDHLAHGTRPSKKATNVRDVKRYLNVATIARDGLLVVKKDIPLSHTRECIIVPRQVLHGLLTAIHIKLVHPSAHQMKSIVHRYFYALDMDKAIDSVTKSCHQCASLKKVPSSLAKFSTSAPQEAIGVSFAADVIKRERQLIFVLRETVTSYTCSCIIDSERSEALREALISLCVGLRPLDGPSAVVRVDPAPGFQGLMDDDLLKKHRIMLELGRHKNINKNPVAEKAVQELEDELLRYDPTGGPVSSLALSIVVAQLNARIRERGLSSREMWYQRDQFTNSQLPMSDQSMIQKQYESRIKNHPHSENSKTPSGKTLFCQVQVGDLVYLYSDRNKNRGRDRYLVVSVDGSWCNVRKFTGSQLRSTSYRVKLSECYKVPTDSNITQSHHALYAKYDNDSSDDEQVDPKPPVLPNVPVELSEPPEILSLPDNVVTVSDKVSGEETFSATPVYNNSEVQNVPRRSTRERKAPDFYVATI